MDEYHTLLTGKKPLEYNHTQLDKMSGSIKFWFGCYFLCKR